MTQDVDSAVKNAPSLRRVELVDEISGVVFMTLFIPTHTETRAEGDNIMDLRRGAAAVYWCIVLFPFSWIFSCSLFYMEKPAILYTFR